MLNGRQRACFAVAWALANCACESALDVDRFNFGGGGAGAMQTGNPLGPRPDGQMMPAQTGVTTPTPAPSPQTGNEPATRFDAGLQPPPPQPGPVASPPTRPVVVSDVSFDSGYAGTQAGSERRGICGEGTVMVGVAFYYYEVGVGADLGGGLGFIAPICGRFGSDPAAPLEWTRDDADDFWVQSDLLLGDPPPPFADQSLGELVCPTRLVVAGARGNMDPLSSTYIIRDITLECAPANEVPASSQVIVDRGGATFVTSSILPFAGVEQYSIGCDNGNVATGLFESSGSWMDGFALSCTSLRRPRVAGDACSAADACQSGVCNGSGSCAAVAQ
jgi:hypothetical protein